MKEIAALPTVAMTEGWIPIPCFYEDRFHGNNRKDKKKIGTMHRATFEQQEEQGTVLCSSSIRYVINVNVMVEL